MSVLMWIGSRGDSGIDVSPDVKAEYLSRIVMCFITCVGRRELNDYRRLNAFHLIGL